MLDLEKEPAEGVNEEALMQQIVEDAVNKKPRQSLQHSIMSSLEYTKSKAGVFLKGENKSMNHLIFEVNEFYIEMMNKLRMMRSQPGAGSDDDEDDSDTVLAEVVDAIERQRNDPHIRKKIEAILKMDDKLEKNYEILRNVRTERKEVQEELCEMLDNDNTPNPKAQMFQRLCRLEKGSKSADIPPAKRKESPMEDEPNNEPNNEPSSSEGNRQTINAAEENRTFIERNKKLAKNMNMSNCSLTDEEKMKIETLLNEGEEEDDINPETERLNKLKQYSSFLFNEADALRLNELEAKLQELDESETPGGSTMTSQGSELFDRIEKDEKDGKYWKHEERLKRIEEGLRKLQDDRENEEAPSRIEVDEELVTPAYDSEELVRSYDNEGFEGDDEEETTTANDGEFGRTVGDVFDGNIDENPGYFEEDEDDDDDDLYEFDQVSKSTRHERYAI